MKYRIFAQDVGARGYSGVEDVTVRGGNRAGNVADAHAVVVWAGQEYPFWRGKHIALPHDRKDLWPHRTTGRVPPEALKFR